MTTQTELLAALDRAIEELRASYLRFSNERDDEKTIATLTALREQIAKGPVKWMDTKTKMTAESSHVGFVPLYTLTGADR